MLKTPVTIFPSHLGWQSEQPEVHVETNAVITLNLHMQKRFQTLGYGQPRRYLCTPRDGHEVCTSTSRQAVLQAGDGAARRSRGRCDRPQRCPALAVWCHHGSSSAEPQPVLWHRAAQRSQCASSRLGAGTMASPLLR